MARLSLSDRFRPRIAALAFHRTREENHGDHEQAHELAPMSGRMFDPGRHGFGEKLIGWVADNQGAALFDPTQPAPWTKQITGVTNANPAVYASASHGFSAGDIVLVGGVTGNLSVNQLGRVASPTTNTFQMVTLEGAGIPIAGSGAYTGGGWAVNLTQATFVSDVIVGNGRVGTDAEPLLGRTDIGGVLSASNWIWSAVTAGYVGQLAWAIIFYDAAGGSDGTNRLVAINDGKLQVVCNTTANGGDLKVLVEPLIAGIPSSTTVWFSNGQSATLTLAANQGDRLLTVSALGGAIPAGHQADVIATIAGLPFMPNGGNVNFTVPVLWFPGLPTALMAL
jgi:hypothetical protein